MSGYLINTEHISTYSKTKRSTTDPKTQMRCRPTLQDTTNPYGLRRDIPNQVSHPTPTDQGPEMSTGKESSPVYNSSNKSCQDPLSTQNTSQHTSARAKAPTRSTCIIHPANRVRIPYQHKTHLNIHRQGPRHLPDNKTII